MRKRGQAYASRSFMEDVVQPLQERAERVEKERDTWKQWYERDHKVRHELEDRLREIQIATVQAVMDLMNPAGTLHEQTDTIVPYGNGYSTWFIASRQVGTYGLTAEQIVSRIEQRVEPSEDSSHSLSEGAQS